MDPEGLVAKSRARTQFLTSLSFTELRGLLAYLSEKPETPGPMPDNYVRSFSAIAAFSDFNMREMFPIGKIFDCFGIVTVYCEVKDSYREGFRQSDISQLIEKIKSLLVSGKIKAVPESKQEPKPVLNLPTLDQKVILNPSTPAGPIGKKPKLAPLVTSVSGKPIVFKRGIGEVLVSRHAWERWLERIYNIPPAETWGRPYSEDELVRLQQSFFDTVRQNLPEKAAFRRLLNNSCQPVIYFYSNKDHVRFVVTNSKPHCLLTIEVPKTSRRLQGQSHLPGWVRRYRENLKKIKQQP